jgi:DivIVA domain-containing protein
VTWLFTVLAMAVIALVAGVVTGVIGGGMDAPEPSSPFRGLPPEGIVPGDLETLRFSAVVRGYRMDEVDQVLDRVAEELRRRDDEIARLRSALGGALPDGLPVPAESGFRGADGAGLDAGDAGSEEPAQNAPVQNT